jgi:hypothetical protein
MTLVSWLVRNEITKDMKNYIKEEIRHTLSLWPNIIIVCWTVYVARMGK